MSSSQRNRPAKLYDLYTFGVEGCPLSVNGAFRDNIRQFLQECEAQDYQIQKMPGNSPKRPTCNHCRICGWGSNFASKRNYHLIIPCDDDKTKKKLDSPTHLLRGLIHCNGFGHLLCINSIEGGSEYLCGKEIMDLWDRICSNLRVRKITVNDVAKKGGMDLRLLYGVAYWLEHNPAIRCR